MAGGWYTSAVSKAFTGTLGDITAASAVKVMLLTSSYTFNVDHDFRSELTNEVSVTGYTAGGSVAAVTATADDTNNRTDIVFGTANITWTVTGTLTARYAVYYRARGGAASADELLFINGFGSDVTATNDVFTLPPSTFRFSNTSTP
jgi:hypothetical protein